MISEEAGYFGESLDKVRIGARRLGSDFAERLGPHGRYFVDEDSVMCYLAGESSHGTGVEIDFDWEDERELQGAMLVRNVANKTIDKVGDGASTASVLAANIIEDSMQRIDDGADPSELNTGIKMAIDDVVESIRRMSRSATSIDTLKMVASTASKGDQEVKSLLHAAIESARGIPTITLEVAGDKPPTVETPDGMHFDSGYVSQQFVTNPVEMTCEFDEPRVLIYDGTLDRVKEITRLIDEAAQSGTALVLIATAVKGEALRKLVKESVRGNNITVVCPPGAEASRKSIMEDLAIATGGPIIGASSVIKLENVKLNDLGRCRKIVIGQGQTNIFQDEPQRCEAIQRKREEIESLLLDADAETKPDLTTRLQNLTAGVRITLPGAGMSNFEEKLARIRGALNAIRAAPSEGVIDGGAAALFEAAQGITCRGMTPDQQSGVDIVRSGLEKLRNSILRQGKPSSFGFSKPDDPLEGRLEDGLLDSVKITRTALEGAAAGAAEFLLPKAADDDDSVFSALSVSRGPHRGPQAPATNTKIKAPRTRYLNAGLFYVAGDRLVPSETPVALDDGPYQLGVNIAAEFWGPGEHGAFPGRILDQQFRQKEPLELQVVVSSLDVGIEPAQRPLLLSKLDDSKLLFFLLNFKQSGRQFIAVDVLYCGNLLQSRRLEVMVVERQTETLPESAWPVQDGYITFTRTAELDVAQLKWYKKHSRSLTIAVERDVQTNRIGLRFYENQSGELGFQQSTLTDSGLDGAMSAVRQELHNTMQAYAGGIGLDENQLANHLGKLASVGRSFYLQLLPGWDEQTTDEGQCLPGSLPPGQVLQVAPLSEQLSVPWEILYERKIEHFREGRISLCDSFRQHKPDECPHEGNPRIVCPHGFWGYRYLIEQLPCRVDPHDLPTHSLPLTIRNGLPLNFRALVNQDLKRLDNHLQTLGDMAPEARIKLNRCESLDEAEQLLSNRDDPADVIYFYTHAGKDALGSPFVMVGREDQIYVIDLDAWEVDLSGHPPLVVLNACGTADYGIHDFESLIKSFCDRGAAGVIGTQCVVKGILADVFTAEFFKQFFQGQAAGIAMFKARRALLEQRDPDPRGLAYSLFASADVKLAEPVIVP